MVDGREGLFRERREQIWVFDTSMGTSKTEVNLRRLLAFAPQQQNQGKLIHYVSTLRELLEQLADERTPEGLPRVSKAVLNDYAGKIEEIATSIATVVQLSEDNITDISASESPSRAGESPKHSEGLRRRVMPQSNRPQDSEQGDDVKSVKLDAGARAHIEKHRKLQEDLTDEMVDLARQLKESSLLMNQSIKNTEKILDSTEKAVESSLASTGHASTRAMEVYSQSSKTSCFTWLILFSMTCVFMMVVLLIRVT